MRQEDGGHHRCLPGVEDGQVSIWDACLRSRKGLQPLYGPNHPWLHASRVRVTMANLGNSMGLGFGRMVLAREESQLRS